MCLGCIFSLNVGPGIYCKSRPSDSSGKSISLKRIATSKSNSSIGPIAVSMASSGFLQRSSNV